ncbi:hypothetical protein IU485_10745 [Nocardia cyriacigeorgica]|uniref:hypothetical protein n=1 Tax=Nocardia cyriacigeorgica TaxID=135487 RepID=UPI001892DF98|nr:hypothetical protein [Nocardia cyriacigeorgica]MBF6081837.1 hypothetical protein [Nocardia cyriacigeorgica]
MTDQHPTSRQPGLARLLALVVLLGGIVGMHVGVFDLGHAWGGTHHGVDAGSDHSHGAGPVGPVGAVPAAAHAGVNASHPAAAASHADAAAWRIDATPAHAEAAASELVVTAPAPQDFPAARSEKPAHSAQPVADFGLVARADSFDQYGTEPLPHADQFESALLAGTFAAPLLSFDALGDHEQDCGDCGAHGGIHACVFILSMLGLAIGLVLLFRLAFQPLSGQETPGGRRPARRERPPPWTMPTLSKLSILRI